MPNTNATKKRKPANTFNLPDHGKIARRKEAQRQKELSDEQRESANDEEIDRLYKICTASIVIG
jgi:hypothetical protein